MVKTYGLTHLALAVSDLDRSVHFYRLLLGAVEVFRQENFVQLQTPGSHDALVLIGKKEAGPAGGILHFGFLLKDPAEIEAAARDAEAAGGVIRDRGEHCPGEPYVFVLDPDGYEVELWYEPPTGVESQS